PEPKSDSDLTEPPNPRTREPPMSHPVISLDHVTRVYGEGDSAVHALRGVNLTVHAGELVAIMRTSGSGKSTMLNILGCLHKPTGGHYVLDGIAVETMS